MTSATVAPESDVSVVGSTAVQPGPIVVATDGTPACDEALRTARRLTAQNASEVVVLSVVEPAVVVPMDFGIALPYAAIEDAQRQARLHKVLEQLDRVGARNAGWTVKLEYGDPASTIAMAAQEKDASVVITGLGDHELVDRVIGSETALRIVRASRSPVLSVPGEYAIKTLPTRAIVATDFSVTSLDGALAALRLFPSITMLYLVHVMPRFDVPQEVLATWADVYSEPVATSFERLTSRLDLPPSITSEPITLEGKPAREILRFAREKAVDLIVTGSRGEGLMTRLLVGSTATGIIRGADCAVLAVPAAPGSARLVGVEEFADGPEAETTWAEELATFTRRNAGRRASLEVDDPDYGMLLQEHGYPLLGIAYDRHDKRVSIMLGDFEGTRRHLTRGISNVHSVDVLRDANGRDRVLRVAHGRGQTLLTLEN